MYAKHYNPKSLWNSAASATEKPSKSVLQKIPLKSLLPHVVIMFCTYTMAVSSTLGDRRISTYLCNGAPAFALHHVYHGTSSVVYALRLPWLFSSQAPLLVAFRLPCGRSCGCNSCYAMSASTPAQRVLEPAPKGYEVEWQVMLDSPDGGQTTVWAVYPDMYQTNIEKKWMRGEPICEITPAIGLVESWRLNLNLMIQQHVSSTEGVGISRSIRRVFVPARRPAG